jgi:hypothetical protein
MERRARARGLVLRILLATLLIGQTSSLRGQTERFRRERNPLVLVTIRKASDRLANPACQLVFTDFRDQEGRTLQDKLISLGHTGQTYLGEIAFYDLSLEMSCERTSRLALTSPGSHAVFLCSRRLIKRIVSDPGYAIAIIIHEELHSLGLGENPPSSEEISRQVLLRCVSGR